MRKSAILLFLFCLPIQAKTRTTTWRPDTCDSVFNIHFDDSNPDTIIKVTMIQPCSAYKGLDDQTAYNTIVAENRKKNVVAQNIYDAMVTISTAPAIKAQADSLKVMEDTEFSYDKDRNLTFKLPIDSKVIPDIQTAIDSKMGVGTVTITAKSTAGIAP